MGLEADLEAVMSQGSGITLEHHLADLASGAIEQAGGADKTSEGAAKTSEGAAAVEEANKNNRGGKSKN